MGRILQAEVGEAEGSPARALALLEAVRRVLVIAALLLVLVLGWQLRNVGRYAIVPAPDSGARPIVLDTRAGVLFYIFPKPSDAGSPASVEVRLTTGEIVRHSRSEK